MDLSKHTTFFKKKNLVNLLKGSLNNIELKILEIYK